MEQELQNAEEKSEQIKTELKSLEEKLKL